MGIEAAIIGSAAIGAASSAATQAANASAQSKLNKKTMDFNHKEAELAREWQAQQDAINRIFNANQSSAQRSWASNEAVKVNNFNAAEAEKSRKFEAAEAVKARSFNAQQSLLARQFEERMSSTAHQREMADLQAAGLNPILTATGGSGASTPSVPVVGSPLPSSSSASGVMPSGSAASGGSGRAAAAMVHGLNAYMKKDVVGQFINSALEGMRVNNDLIKAQAQDKQADASIRNSITNELNGISQRIKNNAEVLGIKENTELTKLKQISEKEFANKCFQEACKIVQEKLDNHELAKETINKLRSDASAYAAAMYSQAGLNNIRGQIESAKSPHEIALLKKEAGVKQEVINNYKFEMSDPEKLARRDYYSSDGKLKVGFKEIFGGSSFTSAVIKYIK